MVWDIKALFHWLVARDTQWIKVVELGEHWLHVIQIFKVSLTGLLILDHEMVGSLAVSMPGDLVILPSATLHQQAPVLMLMVPDDRSHIVSLSLWSAPILLFTRLFLGFFLVRQVDQKVSDDVGQVVSHLFPSVSFVRLARFLAGISHDLFFVLNSPGNLALEDPLDVSVQRQFMILRDVFEEGLERDEPPSYLIQNRCQVSVIAHLTRASWKVGLKPNHESFEDLIFRHHL